MDLVDGTYRCMEAADPNGSRSTGLKADLRSAHCYENVFGGTTLRLLVVPTHNRKDLGTSKGGLWDTGFMQTALGWRELLGP